MGKASSIKSYRKMKWPGGMRELLDIIEDTLKRQGYQKEECSKIAATVVRAMSYMAGGRGFYLPKGNSIDVALKHLNIFEDYTGDNVTELARKYRLSEVQIYSILRQYREANQSTSDSTPDHSNNE